MIWSRNKKKRFKTSCVPHSQKLYSQQQAIGPNSWQLSNNCETRSLARSLDIAKRSRSVSMKQFKVPEMTFKGHSRSPRISRFVRSPGLFIGDQKSRIHLFSDKNSWNNLQGQSRSLAAAQFNRPHINFYWSVVVNMCLSRTFLRYSTSNNGVSLKSGLKVIRLRIYAWSVDGRNPQTRGYLFAADSMCGYLYSELEKKAIWGKVARFGRTVTQGHRNLY